MIGAALRSVAQKGAELARQIAEETSSLGQLSNFKYQREYKLGPQTGTVGAHGVWRIFAGTARSPTAIVRNVSIWVLDKRELASRGEGTSLQAGSHSSPSPAQQHQRWDLVLEQQRQGCALMTRLKHPGVVRVVLPLEENAAHMVLVTEAVRGCLREQLQLLHHTQQSTEPSDHHPQHPQQQRQHLGAAYHGGPEGDLAAAAAGAAGAGAAGTAAAAAAAPLSALEVKLGLLALAEVLTFLHGTARLAHCGLAPRTVVVVADGGWKLAGFSFAVSLDYLIGGGGGLSYGGGGGASSLGPGRPPYEYSDPFPPLWEELAKPQLPYTAPELVVPPGGVAAGSHWPAASSSASACSNPFLSPPPPPIASWAAADSFSLGTLAYEVIMAAEAAAAVVAGGGAAAGALPQLLPVRCSVQQYSSRLAALAAAGGGGGAGGVVQGPVGLAGGPLAADLSRLAPELQVLVLSMVSPSPAARPAPAALARCGWFEADTLLRALRFLGGMVQSELSDKLAFLADLGDEAGPTTRAAAAAAIGSGGGGAGASAGTLGAPGGALWRRLPDRLLAPWVLPPLLQEVRNGGPGALAALPVALAVCRHLGRMVFSTIALPVLAPVMEAAGAGPAGAAAAAGAAAGSTAAGDGAALLAALVGQSEVLAGLMDGPSLDRVLLPMLLRALLGPGLPAATSAATPYAGAPPSAPASPAGPWLADPRLAQAALGRLHALVVSGLLDCRAQQVRTRLLPALLTASGRTTSSGVRTSCLGLMAAMAAKVDRFEAEAIIASCAQLLSVDNSGGTLVAVGALAEAMAEAPSWGPSAAAHRLLPLLSPQLLAAGLSPQQLEALAGSVQALLTRVILCAEEAARLRAGLGGVSRGPLPPAVSAGPGAAGAGGSSIGNSNANGGAKSTTKPSGVLAFTTWTRTGEAAAATAAPAAPPPQPATARPLSGTLTSGQGSKWVFTPASTSLQGGPGASLGGGSGSGWPAVAVTTGNGPTQPQPRAQLPLQSQSQPELQSQPATWLHGSAAAAGAANPFRDQSTDGGYDAGARDTLRMETHGTRPGDSTSCDPFALLAPLPPGRPSYVPAAAGAAAGGSSGGGGTVGAAAPPLLPPPPPPPASSSSIATATGLAASAAGLATNVPMAEKGLLSLGPGVLGGAAGPGESWGAAPAAAGATFLYGPDGIGPTRGPWPEATAGRHPGAAAADRNLAALGSLHIGGQELPAGPLFGVQPATAGVGGGGVGLGGRGTTVTRPGVNQQAPGSGQGGPLNLMDL